MGLLCCSGVFLDKPMPATLLHNCPGDRTNTQLQHSTRMTQHTSLDNPTPAVLFKKMSWQENKLNVTTQHTHRTPHRLGQPNTSSPVKKMSWQENKHNTTTHHTHTHIPHPHKHIPTHPHTVTTTRPHTQSQNQTDNVTGTQGTMHQKNSPRKRLIVKIRRPAEIEPVLKMHVILLVSIKGWDIVEKTTHKNSPRNCLPKACYIYVYIHSLYVKYTYVIRIYT